MSGKWLFEQKREGDRGGEGENSNEDQREWSCRLSRSGALPGARPRGVTCASGNFCEIGAYSLLAESKRALIACDSPAK